MWNYLNMIIHVREKNPLEYNGWEGYIAEMLEARPAAFVASQRCSLLPTPLA